MLTEGSLAQHANEKWLAISSHLWRLPSYHRVFFFQFPSQNKSDKIKSSGYSLLLFLFRHFLNERSSHLPAKTTQSGSKICEWGIFFKCKSILGPLLFKFLVFIHYKKTLHTFPLLCRWHPAIFIHQARCPKGIKAWMKFSVSKFK